VPNQSIPKGNSQNEFYETQACRTAEKQQTLHNEGLIMALASFITIVTAR